MTNEHIYLDDGRCECCEHNQGDGILSPSEKERMLDYICGKGGEGYSKIERIEMGLYALIADANVILKQVDDLRSKLE